MKKVLIVLLSVVFLLALFTGCTKVNTDEEVSQHVEELEAEDDNQEEPTNTPQPTEKPTEKPTEDPEPIILDSLENVEEISYSVPSIWRKKEASDGFYYYPYEDNATLLYVNTSSTADFPTYDITDRYMMTNMFDGVTSGIEESCDDYNQLSSEIEVFEDGSYYLFLNYKCVFFENEYEMLSCTFFTSTRSYSITFGQPSGISEMFREAYGMIFDTLQISPEMAATDNAEPTATDNPEPTAADNAEPTSDETASQREAVRTAKDYLKYIAFSREGLIDQLEYEGFTEEDATYGVDNCGADWMEQAVKCAKSYLDNMAFSRKGLIDQLEYEGFTKDEAIHGVDNSGADWMEQAVKCAKSYLDYMEFTRNELIDQLEYEGFTNEQAVYGVEENGL